jgi:multidrug efflux pump subunit AcrA (membrane-fusion protein)
MVIPVPKNIQAPATLRAKDTWRACAIRDCVVEAIHVDHGQSVESGEVLMTLSDPNLDQQRTQLVGRRAVLAEQKIRLTEQMMSSSTSDFDEYESIQSQRGIVDEEIAAVNQQMSLLDRIQETMTIRSDRDGTVDAWQIHKRLGGRPVSRGDVLMQVVSTNSQWVVDAEVAQNRIGRVQNADQQHELSAVVTLVELPGEVLIASQWEFGPTSQSSVPGQASTEVTLVLDIGQEDETHQNVGTLRSGSPAKVLFHCGDVPLADLLVGDLYREIKTTLAMHWNVTAANDQTLRGKETP